MEFMDEQERYLFGGIPRDFTPPIEMLGEYALLEELVEPTKHVSEQIQD